MMVPFCLEPGDSAVPKPDSNLGRPYKREVSFFRRFEHGRPRGCPPHGNWSETMYVLCKPCKMCGLGTVTDFPCRRVAQAYTLIEIIARERGEGKR